MAYRAERIADNPLDYFLHDQGEPSPLRVADVILRQNKDPKEIFSRMIRIGTGSKWSHSSLVYLPHDPRKGFNNTFLVEAKTKGIFIVSWRNEVVPFEQFTVGIKRPSLDWYVETPYERAQHDPGDPEDTHAIAYLRHVRGIAFDQINGLYDKKTVYELAALYTKRASMRHLGSSSPITHIASSIANHFKQEDEKETDETQILRFICSGLIQYAFFEALRRRIMNDMEIPEHREAALSNLKNMSQIIFREDPQGLIPTYIDDVLKGKLDIHQPAPDDVLDLLKTAVPADFNNDPRLQWRYVISKGIVWRITQVGDDYQPENKDEAEILTFLQSEHRTDGEDDDG